jgi:hypothetical protein
MFFFLIFDYLLLLKPFSYFHGTEDAENSYIFKEIHKYVMLSLSEPKTKTVVEL